MIQVKNKKIKGKKSFLRKFTTHRLFSLLPILLIVLIIPITLYISHQTTITQNHAFYINGLNECERNNGTCRDNGCLGNEISETDTNAGLNATCPSSGPSTFCCRVDYCKAAHGTCSTNGCYGNKEITSGDSTCSSVGQGKCCAGYTPPGDNVVNCQVGTCQANGGNQSPSSVCGQLGVYPVPGTYNGQCTSVSLYSGLQKGVCCQGSPGIYNSGGNNNSGGSYGVACNKTGNGTGCSIPCSNNQYCESVTGTCNKGVPLVNVYQCMNNHWNFKYPQAGDYRGECGLSCKSSPLSNQGQSSNKGKWVSNPHGKYARCGNNAVGVCTDQVTCPNGKPKQAYLTTSGTSAYACGSQATTWGIPADGRNVQCCVPKNS